MSSGRSTLVGQARCVALGVVGLVAGAEGAQGQPATDLERGIFEAAVEHSTVLKRKTDVYMASWTALLGTHATKLKGVRDEEIVRRLDRFEQEVEEIRRTAPSFRCPDRAHLPECVARAREWIRRDVRPPHDAWWAGRAGAGCMRGNVRNGRGGSGGDGADDQQRRGRRY